VECGVQEWQEDEEAQEQLRLAIQSLVGMLFFKRVEVPVVAMFHKEVLGELLSTREFEVPRTVTVLPPFGLERVRLSYTAGLVAPEVAAGCQQS
jgi:hypothetical protein